MEEFQRKDFQYVTDILIRSERMSFIQSKEVIHIWEYENGYLMDCINDSSYNNIDHIELKNIEVPARKIKQLEDCLFKPQIRKGEFLTCNNIMRWLKKYDEFRDVSNIEISEYIINKLKETNYLKNKAINKYFNKSGSADSYPYVRVEIKFKTGDIVIIESSMKRELMLPWSIILNDNTYEDCNLDINLAIADLMPKKFTNRRLVIGEKYFMQLLSLNIGIRY